ncbi:MAG TPA: hypothetical protein VGR13_04580 [Actinomycetota bacterium]|nr:hypothetical protein [Actinomycetota bacterium]
MTTRLLVRGWARVQANLFELLIGVLVVVSSAATLVGQPPSPTTAHVLENLGSMASWWLGAQLVAGVVSGWPSARWSPAPWPREQTEEA